ncbi:MAG TPA: hypothetical protein VLJ21_01655 [Candidatus Binatia bacterium]|nr:hypothetical protein [Candidatus Binatia bacterium]
MKAVVPVIFILLAVAVSATSPTVKSAVESFFTNDVPDVVIGNLNLDDQFAAFAFANELGLKNYTLPAKMRNVPLIVVGGPCANPVWHEYSDETCDAWPYPEGKAVVIAHQTSTGKTIILIGGTSGKDTRAAAKYVLASFSDAKFLDAHVVLDTAGLPLANENLKVYKTENLNGASSAQGSVIIELPDESSMSDEDLADGLKEYLMKSYPYAGVAIEHSSNVHLSTIQGKILVALQSQPLISVEPDAPSSHVVIASAASFYLAGQGLTIQPTATHDQLSEEDLQFT